MSDILTFNQSIFGTKLKERSLSKKANRIKTDEIITPSDSEIIAYDDGYLIDGGGTIKLGFTFTIGAVVSSTIISTIVGYISGYATTKSFKLGAMIGGFWGAIVGAAIGVIVGIGISSMVNSVLYPGGTGIYKVTLLNMETGLFGKKFEYYFDIGNLLGVCLGGPLGFAAAYAQGAAFALAS